MTPNWFVSPLPSEHEIVFPGAVDVAAYMRRHGDSEEQVEAYLAENTITVSVRGLTAGDKAKLDELKFTQDGDARLSFGENQLVMMEMAIVSWSLDAPVSKETIGRLDPLVAAAILEAIPEGRLLIDGERGEANGSGPPPQAAIQTPPTPKPRDAALEP